ncbi:MAG: F0F1 ATP synthase subunit A [Chloroflexota bacterium]|nr:F0F1 ATP synthase subunit A [Chloroflexota bacterium]
MDTVFAINIPHVSLPAEELFKIGPLSITNSNLQMLLVMIGIVLFFALVTRKLALVPGRRQALAEIAVEGLFNFTVSTAGSRKLARRIFPLAATLFIFILLANYSGLLPGVGTIYITKNVPVAAAEVGNLKPEEKTRLVTNPDGTMYLKNEQVPIFRSPNADLNMTLAMALIVVVLVQIMGLQAHGAGGYFKELFTPVWLGPIHIVGEISRIVSLSFRLFGNIFGGEVLVTMMYALTFLVIPTVFLGLELFFGLIQALIFFILTIVYIQLAVAGHDGHGDEEEDERQDGRLVAEANHLG